MPRRAKVVDVLAVRLVKQGTETTRFRTGSPLHLCQYVYMQASMIILYYTVDDKFSKQFQRLVEVELAFRQIVDTAHRSCTYID